MGQEDKNNLLGLDHEPVEAPHALSHGLVVKLCVQPHQQRPQLVTPFNQHWEQCGLLCAEQCPTSKSPRLMALPAAWHASTTPQDFITASLSVGFLHCEAVTRKRRWAAHASVTSLEHSAASAPPMVAQAAWKSASGLALNSSKALIEAASSDAGPAPAAAGAAAPPPPPPPSKNIHSHAEG